VHPVDVEVVGAQPLQAGVERQSHVLAVVPYRVGIVPVAGDGVLGGKYEPVPAAGKQLAEDLLAGPAAVVDGGVGDVAARVGVGIQDPLALLGSSPTPSCSPKVIAPRKSSDTRSPLVPNAR
jgi:hypothetical protein